jgi:hypothetical protein
MVMVPTTISSASTHTWEVEEGGSGFEDSLGKPCLNIPHPYKWCLPCRIITGIKQLKAAKEH